MFGSKYLSARYQRVFTGIIGVNLLIVFGLSFKKIIYFDKKIIISISNNQSLVQIGNTCLFWLFRVIIAQTKSENEVKWK